MWIIHAGCLDVLHFLILFCAKNLIMRRKLTMFFVRNIYILIGIERRRVVMFVFDGHCCVSQNSINVKDGVCGAVALKTGCVVAS
jgi:hypothetical protein